jgi:UDP-N-acetyl-D-glucosamine dehydrogenase
VADIHAGLSRVQDVCDTDLQHAVTSGRFHATNDFTVLHDVDTVSICVPTPLNKTKDPDISYVVATAEAIRVHLHPGQLIVLESTTYPGTTDEVLLPMFHTTGLQVGSDFFLAFSPERIDPGNTTFRLSNTPKILGGVTAQCTQIAASLYQQIIATVVPVSSSRAAELVKLLENTFRAVNIGLVNEVALMCARLGLDVWEVIDAAATKPFGFMPFYPGPGLGGHCIPLIPTTWPGSSKRSIIGPVLSNWPMTSTPVCRTMSPPALPMSSTKSRKALKGRKSCSSAWPTRRIRMTFGNIRESPALEILRLLHAKGSAVYFHDPFIAEVDIPGARSTALTAQILNWADCVVITTNHSVYDYPWIVEQARLIVDTRNATRYVKDGREKIHKL